MFVLRRTSFVHLLTRPHSNTAPKKRADQFEVPGMVLIMGYNSTDAHPRTHSTLRYITVALIDLAKILVQSFCKVYISIVYYSRMRQALT